MKWLIVTKERYTYGTAVKAPPKVIVPASRPVTKIDPCLLSVCVPAASATPSVNPCTTHTRTQCQRRMNGRREDMQQKMNSIVTPQLDIFNLEKLK